MVSSYVEIKSKSYITKNKSAYWRCDGNTEFEIKESDKKERGTEIILHINDVKEYWSDCKIKYEEVNKWSSSLGVVCESCSKLEKKRIKINGARL